jgi:tetratricopeptide (TPR) repeat protein
LQVLLDGKSKNPDQARTWDRAICQYREMSHDPDAAKAWETLGDAYPKDLAVQSAIVSSEESAWSDRAFMDRTIKRLRDLTGEQATAWKVASARLLLMGAQSDQDISAAIVLLDEVINLSPEEYLPHELLATAYERTKNNAAAIDQWRKAATLQPDLALPNFNLLRMLQADGKVAEAQAVFDKLASLQHLPPEMAVQAARMMAADGDNQRAEAILTGHEGGTTQVPHDATLAQIYRREGRDNDAAALYFKLLKSPNLDATTIREAADFFGSRHDLTNAHQWLDRLGALSLSPGERELILANFEENHGDPAAAATLYDDAVKAAGDDPDAAVARIGYLIRRQQWEAARRDTASALARWPANNALLNLKSAQDTFAASTDAKRLEPLLMAISLDPQNDAGNQTLRVMANADPAHPASTVKSLQDLLAKYPNFEPLYTLTINGLLSLGRNDDMLALAATVLERFPQSASAAAGAADAYMLAGDWADALVAAREWRLRDPDHRADADRIIATADVLLGQPRDAVGILAPYIPQAKAHPDDNQAIIDLYAQALIQSGDEADAVALLQPLADSSPTWRAHWLKMAAFSHADGASAAAWIEQIRPRLDPNSMTDQQELADAYVQVAQDRAYPQGFQIAYDTLKPLVASDHATVPVLATFAAAAAGIHDRIAAEQAYRQILKINPNLSSAQNNLADFLRQNGDMASLKEAETLSRAAIASNPSQDVLPNYYDTLARILLAQGKVNEAIAAFEAGYKIQPKNMSLLIGLAYANAKSGQLEIAADFLARIDALVAAGIKVPEELRADLDSARVAAKKTEARNSVTGSDAGTTSR